MAASSMSLKLLIDPKGQRVLYAEAAKDFVDFLVGMLTLPVGSIIDLSQKHALEFSLAKLYDSIQNLNESYIQPNQSKTILLKPAPLFSGSSAPLLGINDAKDDQKCYYMCDCETNISDDKRLICPDCHEEFYTKLTYIAPPAVKHTGYVKGVTYLVMDDLAFMPFSTSSCFTLLTKFDVIDTSMLEERVVDFGKDEAMKLLGAVFQSKMVLTDVFLKGNVVGGRVPKVEKRVPKVERR